MAKLKKIILVADDDQTSRYLLREILTEAGYDVLEAADGQEELSMIETKSIDLLITDRSMPGLGGLELLTALRDRRKSMPALMISAHGDEAL